MKVEPASGSVAPSVATTVPAAAFSCDGAAGDGDVGRGLVLVGDGDVDRLGAGEAAGVGDGDVDLVRGGGLVVEAGAGLDADLVADDLELAGRVGGSAYR